MFVTTATVESTTALLRTLAADNGGYLTTKDYERLAPPNSPSFKTIYTLFNGGSWQEICAIVGICANYSATLPPVLDEAQIREMLRRGFRGQYYSLEHRKQVVVWCLHKAAETLGTCFSKLDYESVYEDLKLPGTWVVSAAFDDSWNKALIAAGLLVPSPRTLGQERKQYASRHDAEAHQQAVVDGMIVEAVPADWRLREWPMTAFEPVTSVTVYRHAQVDTVGLRCTETRMVLR